MGIIEEERQTKEALVTFIDELLETEVRSLIRSEDLGRQFDFRAGKKSFEGILRFLKELAEVDMDIIPLGQLKTIVNEVSAVSQNFKNIKEFDPKNTQNAASMRNNHLQESLNRYDSLFNIVSPIICYSERKKDVLTNLEKEAKNKIAEIENITLHMKGAQTEAEGTLKKIKDTAGEVGVKEYAIHFKKEAESHKKTSSIWLFSTIFFALATLGFVIYIFRYYLKNPPEFTTSQSIQIGIAKIAIVAILYYAMVWTGRIYTSHIHNFVVNQHRQHALNTFETFVTATKDGDVVKIPSDKWPIDGPKLAEEGYSFDFSDFVNVIMLLFCC